MDATDYADQLAQAFGETEPEAVRQLRLVVEALGVEQMQAVATEARVALAAGGLSRRDGAPRTPGGVLFHLAKGRLSWPDRRRIFARPAPPAFRHEDRLAVAALPGEASVRITLITRPLAVETRGPLVVLRARNDEPPRDLHPALPPPPPDPTIYLVYLSAKAWGRVAPALSADATDRLIVEGWCAADPQTGGYVVWTVRVATVLRERARRAELKRRQDGAA